MKDVIYARYSSDKQTEDSIEAQARACNTYAASKGHAVIGTYVDEAISGKGSKTASRAQYQKMLRDCDKGLFDTILVHKYDRIARNIGEHVNLEYKLKAKGITLIAVAQDFGNSNEAKIMRTLVWAMSEYYIDNLSDEVKKGHKETALKGLHNGGVAPFGYDIVDQKYVINELEAGYVRKMFDAVIHSEGYVALVEELAERGITGKRGKPIKHSQINEILKNEKYTGVYLYSPKMESVRSDRRQKPNAIRIEDAIPPIISKEQFEEVQEIMSERKQVGKKADYLCSGLVYCTCGAKMHAMTTHRKGHEYRYYSCSKKCGAPVVRMGDVDDAALRYLHELLSDKNQKVIAKALKNFNSTENVYADGFKKALKQRIDEKQKQYNQLMDNLSSSSLPPTVVADIGQRMQELKEEIDALEKTEPPEDMTTDYITNWLNALKATPDERAVHLLIERIDTKEKTAFNITSTLKTVLGENGRGDRI